MALFCADFEAVLFAGSRLSILPIYRGMNIQEIISSGMNLTRCTEVLAFEFGFKNANEMHHWFKNKSWKYDEPIFFRPWLFPEDSEGL